MGAQDDERDSVERKADADQCVGPARISGASSGTTRPTPRATANAVNPVRHQASRVRSPARSVRRSHRRLSVGGVTCSNPLSTISASSPARRVGQAHARARRQPLRRRARSASTGKPVASAVTLWRNGTTILLLTTTGRKSGEERTTPTTSSGTAGGAGSSSRPRAGRRTIPLGFSTSRRIHGPKSKSSTRRSR